MINQIKTIALLAILLLSVYQIGNHERQITFLEKSYPKELEYVIPAEEISLDTCIDFTLSDWIDYCTSIRSLDPKEVCAIIKTESNWDATAVSTTEDYGLMQIHGPYWDTYFGADPETVEQYKVPNDPLNPYANVLAGCNALAYWKNVCQERGESENVDYLSCYNQGYNYFISFDQGYADLVLANLQETSHIRD